MHYPAADDTLVIGCASLPDAAITAAVEVLGQAIEEAGG
jgi:DNA-binding transcriptional MocR family regulator